MSVVHQAPKIRLWHSRPRWQFWAMLAASAAWGTAVAVGITFAPELVPDALLGVWFFWVLGIGGFLAMLAGGIGIVGYHRARGDFPARAWHFSAKAWSVGEEFSLHPQHCKPAGRMVRSLRWPRRATYVFDRRPTRADVAANRTGHGTLYELEVLEAPSAHYRRWDGTGAVGSLNPIRVRVVAAEDTHAIR